MTDAPKKSEKKPEKSSIIPIIGAAIVGFFVGMGQITDSMDKLLIFIHFKPDAFSVAEDNAKSLFSKHLIELAWKRLFADRNFVRTVELGLDNEKQELAWKAHSISVESWNIEIMNLILGVQQYYGDKKRNALEGKIQENFGRIGDCISKIRYPDFYAKKNNPMCQPNNQDVRNEKTNIEVIKELIDDQNTELYCFASGITDNKSSC